MSERDLKIRALKAVVLLVVALSLMGCSDDKAIVAPSDPCEESIIPIEELDSQPIAVSRPAPVYPYEARRDLWQGEVTVRMFLNKDGTVCSSEVAISSERDDVDASALAATRQWRFESPIKDESPVRTAIESRIVFKLAG